MSPTMWLASYPKSGNTWFRTFLANLLRDDEEPAHINELRTGTIAGARPPFDLHTGLEASDLTEDEVDLLRPAVYRRMAAKATGTGYHKVHDAYVRNRDGEPLFPADATLGAVYLIRNPLDVAPSYAHHSVQDVAWAVQAMANPAHAMASFPRRLTNQLRQILLTWSGHVTSWVDNAPFPVLVVRYEDMHFDAEEAFTRAVRFMGLPHDRDAIRKAIEFSSFEVVKAQEEEHGFRERNPQSASFFRKGEVGSWREELTGDQAEQIIADHGAVMERFGYLAAGRPVF